MYIDEHLIFDKDTDDDGDCTDGGGSSRYFYAQQANWNVVAVTDSSGDTAEKIKYDPYGEATVTVQGGHSSTGNLYLFQGRRWDDEVDLYYFRNRVMSTVLGRFVQRDPIGYGNGANLYGYVGGHPLTASDPHGLDYIDVKRKTVIWVTEKTGFWRSRRGTSFTIGELLEDGQVKILHHPWGNGCISLEKLKAFGRHCFLGKKEYGLQRAIIRECLQSGKPPECGKYLLGPECAEFYANPIPTVCMDCCDEICQVDPLGIVKCRQLCFGLCASAVRPTLERVRKWAERLFVE